MEKRTRLAAYGICRRDDQLLLAHYVSGDGKVRHWTLPGGGVDHGEDPYDAVVREFEEETGYVVEVDELLGFGSRHLDVDWGRPVNLHALGIYYTVHVVGGDLRHEVDGSTDEAAWVPIDELPELQRSLLIEIGLQLERERPATGHLEALPPIAGLVQ